MQIMIHVAELFGGDIQKPSLRASGGKSVDPASYYTQEGAAVIRSALRRGILLATDTEEIGED